MKSAILICILYLCPMAWAQMRLIPSTYRFVVETMAEDLQSPCGMALDPQSGDLLFAEKSANRISIIHEKTSYGLIRSGLEITKGLGRNGLGSHRAGGHWETPRLRRPSDLAFDSKGRLYVTEAIQGGRLLRFPDIHESTQLAEIVSTPRNSKEIGYNAVTVARDERVYIAAAKNIDSANQLFGSLMSLDREGNWWMIDYGPFTDFSRPVVSKDGKSLVVCERRHADLQWYDTESEIIFSEIPKLNGIRHIALLNNNLTIGAIEQDDGTWSIVECDPKQDQVVEWLGGLGAIGGLLAHPDRPELYVSLSEEGKIIKLTVQNWPDQLPDQIAQLRKQDRDKKYLPPEQWPEFFKPFIENLNVIQPVNSHGFAQSKRSMEKVTMGEFAKAIPIISGKFKAELKAGNNVKHSKDPIEEFQFILFAPKANLITRKALVPRISLFYAKHKSGRVKTTSFMHDLMGMKLEDIKTWEEMPEVIMSFPTGYYLEPAPQSPASQIRICFAGMGLGADYFVDINPRNPKRNKMVVETSEQENAHYQLTCFPDRYGNEGQSILIANIDQLEKHWYNLGNRPIQTSIILGGIPQFNFKHSIKVDDFAAQDIVMHSPKAEAFEQISPRKDLIWPRLLVQKAAQTWGDSNF